VDKYDVALAFSLTVAREAKGETVGATIAWHLRTIHFKGFKLRRRGILLWTERDRSSHIIVGQGEDGKSRALQIWHSASKLVMIQTKDGEYGLIRQDWCCGKHQIKGSCQLIVAQISRDQTGQTQWGESSSQHVVVQLQVFQIVESGQTGGDITTQLVVWKIKLNKILQ
jgi:hypothetical protein